MTLSNPTNLVTYTGNGVATEFAYTFKIPDADSVEITLLEIATGAEGEPLASNLYSITGLGEEGGGEVTYPLSGDPLASTHKINIKRVVALEQGLNLTNQSAYFPEELEDQLDKIVMMIQQLDEEVDRSVKTDTGSDTTPDELLDSIADSEAAAAASATAAASSATDAQTAENNAETAQAAAEAAAATLTYASQAEAEAGTEDAKMMSPLRTAQAIAALTTAAGQNDAFFAWRIADLDGARLNMTDGIADAYDSEDDVDTATSTNESYDAGNDLYSPSTSGGGMISAGTGSIIGDIDTRASAMFDGTTSQAGGNAGTKTGTPSNAYAGKNYSASPKKIQSVTAYGSNDNGFVNLNNPSVTITLYGKNGGAPANGTDGTSLGSVTFTDTGNESAGRSIGSNDIVTAWDYVWIYIAYGTSNDTRIAEIQFFEAVTIDNMTLVSDAFTATAVPATARVALFIDPQESITVPDDLTAEVSRDGGTTWTAATLELVSNPVGTVEQWEDNDIDISAQPSGTSMKYRIKTLNNKDIDVTGIVFQWSE